MKTTFFVLFLLWSGVCPGEEKYQRDETSDTNGTYLADHVALEPLFLVKRFGKPAEGDGLRVSGFYTFREKDSGVVFTVYDYKLTTIWATDEGLPTPKQFWKSLSPMQFSIGSKGVNVSAFKKWLVAQRDNWKKDKTE